MVKIAIGADHAGFELKAYLIKALSDRGYDMRDVGVSKSEKADYPDMAQATCAPVLTGEVDYGIVICGTGIGISISANKIPGIRAALCAEPYSARKAKEHNNANVIALGGRTTGTELALEIVLTFLEHEFAGERHAVRVAKIRDMEERGC